MPTELATLRACIASASRQPSRAYSQYPCAPKRMAGSKSCLRKVDRASQGAKRRSRRVDRARQGTKSCSRRVNPANQGAKSRSRRVDRTSQGSFGANQGAKSRPRRVDRASQGSFVDRAMLFEQVDRACQRVLSTGPCFSRLGRPVLSTGPAFVSKRGPPSWQGP